MPALPAAEVYAAIRTQGLVAIVRGLPAPKLLPLAEALIAGGIGLVEVTADTPGAMDMIQALKAATAGRALVGAGTITTPDLAQAAVQAGAEYIIAPDLNPEVVAFCRKRDLAVVPGVMTPSEILCAKRLGLNLVKLFPAGTLGPEYVRQLRGPIKDVDFLAVGGVGPGNLLGFLQAGCQGAGMGSSLTPRQAIAQADWAEIIRLARACRQVLDRFQGGVG